MKYLLLLDYDGTLTPIRKQPRQALLSPNRKKFLRQLADHPKIKMVIISGRKLSTLKKLVGIRNIIYIGNHGFEIDIAGRRWFHPAVKKFRPLLKKIKRTLKVVLPYHGIFIEDKELTISVHYRLLADKKLRAFNNDFFRAVAPWKNKIKVTTGKKVFEIRPPVAWDKGKAVAWIIKKLRLADYFPVYIGDDQTDEDAFKALKNQGLCLKVGHGGKSRADGRLGSVANVYSFLSTLILNY